MAFQFAKLTANQKKFVEAALEVYPDLNDTITSAQIVQVSGIKNIPYPQWLSVPTNRVAKATYSFPHPSASNDEGEQKSYQPVIEVQKESDEEMEQRIRDTYDSMDELVRAVASNTVNSLVIAGGAGLGKSHNVNKTLQEVNEGEYGFQFHRGYLRATHLFRMLYENRHKGMTVVIDDCDAIFSDEVALNILKAALELKVSRRIGWGSEKIFLDEDGEEIPRYFDFEGSVIFLTNLSVRDLINSGSKYAPHLSAIESRSLVLDLKIKSRREYLQVIKIKLEAGLLSDKGFTKEDEAHVMGFIMDNLDHFVELSLRMVEKIASIYKASPHKWEKLCKAVCCK